MKHSVFISYSANDRELADALAQRLEVLGISHFLDTKEISWGESITDLLNQAMRNASAIVVILSPSSIEYKWVMFELGYAMAMQKPILLLLTNRKVELPEFLRGVRVADNVAQIEEYFRSMLCQESTQRESDGQHNKSMEGDEELNNEGQLPIY